MSHQPTMAFSPQLIGAWYWQRVNRMRLARFWRWTPCAALTGIRSTPASGDAATRLEWIARRYGGEPFPVEVVLTPLRLGDRFWLVASSRGISERKKAERELRALNQSLERRVAERTAALTTNEARFRALVDEERS